MNSDSAMPTWDADQLEALLGGQSLSQAQARDLFAGLMAGQLSPARIAALLVALRAKGESVDEVSGAAEAMRAAAHRIASPAGAVDVCGTGGDRSGTVNCSTAAALVVAAAGVPVAKHGNRSVSSRSGSADVLEVLGVPIDRAPGDCERDLHEVGFAFLFAPLFHPAMKHAGPIRRELGIRTIFNLLGPLTNPAGVRRQLMGVFSARWVAPAAEVLGRLGAERAVCVHSEDGLDEISIAADTQIAEWNGREVLRSRISPEELGFRRASLSDLRGGTAEENAAILLRAFERPDGAVADWITLNAGAALRVARDLTWTDAIDLARETVRERRVFEVLERLRSR